MPTKSLIGYRNKETGEVSIINNKSLFVNYILYEFDDNHIINKRNHKVDLLILKHDIFSVSDSYFDDAVESIHLFKVIRFDENSSYYHFNNVWKANIYKNININNEYIYLNIKGNCNKETNKLVLYNSKLLKPYRVTHTEIISSFFFRFTPKIKLINN